MDKTAVPVKTDIYRYDDFRLFLRERFDAHKAADPSFSHRSFAAAAGIANPGYLNDVIKGRKPLSRNAADRMAAAFGMSPKEGEFLRLLAAAAQARTERARDDLRRQIEFRRSRSHFVRTHPGMARYYLDHHYPLVRAAIEVTGFRGDYIDLARFFEPPIPPAAIRKYVRDLCEWGLVAQGTDGVYRVTASFIEPCPTLREQVRRINRDWIVQALDVQQRFPPSERHISTALLNVSAESERKIFAAIERFRAELFEITRQDHSPPQRVIQLNVQCFPQTKRRAQRMAAGGADA
jgi:uncharacterized protein (TIGR02147 family)